MGNPPPPPATRDHLPAQEHVVPLVNVKLAEGVYTDKQKHDMAARLTDVMVAFEGSETFREVVWVLIEELHRNGWHIGGQPSFGPATLMTALCRAEAAYEGIDGTPTTRARTLPPRPPSARSDHQPQQ
jgi:4-oxalocrotonate tautomerase